MALPPSDFAAAFRLHVVPALRALIVEQAASCDFLSVVSEVTAEAHRRGAAFLPPERHAALLDWILVTTSAEVSLADEAADLVRSLLREPSTDVIRSAVRGFLNVG